MDIVRVRCARMLVLAARADSDPARMGCEIAAGVVEVSGGRAGAGAVHRRDLVGLVIVLGGERERRDGARLKAPLLTLRVVFAASFRLILICRLPLFFIAVRGESVVGCVTSRVVSRTMANVVPNLEGEGRGREMQGIPRSEEGEKRIKRGCVRAIGNSGLWEML